MEVVEKLSSFFMFKEIVSQWAGTQLLLGDATIYYFRFNRDTVDILASIEDEIVLLKKIYILTQQQQK